MLNDSHSVSIQELNNSHISSDNGWLNFTDLTLDLAGKYICVTLNNGYGQTFNQTINLVVFKQYLILGIVVMAINGLFICLFLFCMVYTTVRSTLANRKKKLKAADAMSCSYSNIKVSQH